MDLVSEEGLRMDGRRPNELKRFHTRLSPIQSADGSAFLSQGNTQVLCLVYGPKQPTKKQGLLNVVFNIARFSHVGSKERLLELSQLIVQTFEPVILKHTFPKSQIDVYIQVLQTDGSILAAAINATSLALADAGIPMLDLVVGVSGGFGSGQALLDLNASEENLETPQLTIGYLPRSQKISSLHVLRLMLVGKQIASRAS
ncbi:ribosomal protein S5 domain 2-type protein [Gorgonomyces haynaldii]|nr:ribosomal protein S5 domain 2-type protein [Gorgonomyces haynaldii]